MKKILLAIVLFLSFISILCSANLKVWFNEYPGIEDPVGQKLCQAVKNTLAESKQIDVVFDDNPDHMFNFGLWTVNPSDPDQESSKTCYTYEVFFCVSGLPMLYVNSYVESCSGKKIEKTAEYLVNKLIEDAENFYAGYPQYKIKGTVTKE